MAKLGTATVFITGNVKGLNDALGKAQAQTRRTVGNITKTMDSAGRSMAKFGLLAVGALGFAAKSASDFDKNMREVNTLLNLPENEFRNFKKEILEFSTAMGVDATDATNGLYQAISAGVPQVEVIDFLGVAARASVAGVTDLKTAVDGLTTVTNAFASQNLSAEEAADIFFATVKRGKTTFGELSESISMVAPIAAAVGVTFGEIGGLLAALTKNGTPTSQAVTQIASAMTAFLKPSKDMEAALEKIGVASGKNLLEKEGLLGALNKLKEAFEGLGAEGETAINKALGRKEAMLAFFALTGEGMAGVLEDINAVAVESAGSTIAGFEIMADSTDFAIKKTKVAIQNLVIEIGDSLRPALRDLLEDLQPVIEDFAKWAEQNPDLILTLGKLALVVGTGGVLLVGFAKAATAVILLTKLMGGLTIAIAGVIGVAAAGAGVGLLGLVGALLLVAGAGAIIGTAIDKLITDKFPQLKETLVEMAATIVDVFTKLKEFFGFADAAAQLGGRSIQLQEQGFVTGAGGGPITQTTFRQRAEAEAEVIRREASEQQENRRAVRTQNNKTSNVTININGSRLSEQQLIGATKKALLDADRLQEGGNTFGTLQPAMGV